MKFKKILTKKVMFIFQDVFNNLFTIAEKVEIKGVIYDVFALAQDFTVAGGYVYRDLKLSCNNLKISSVVCDYMLDLGSFLVFMLIIWLLCLVLAPRFLEKTKVIKLIKKVIFNKTNV